MLNKVLKWLTAVPGRKRGIAAGLAILAGLMRAGAEAIKRACDAGLSEGGLCSVDLGPWAEGVDFAGQALLQVAEPGVTFAAAAMAVWGLWHARRR